MALCTSFTDNFLNYSAIQILYTNNSVLNETYSRDTNSDSGKELDSYLGSLVTMATFQVLSYNI